MKRLEKFFNMKMIRNRIIAVQLGVIIPAVILLGVMIYGMTSAMLIKTNSESYLKVLESADIILSHYLDSYRDIARNVLADPVLQNDLTISSNSRSGGRRIEERLFVDLDNAMEKYIMGFSGARSIYLYDSRGRLFYLDDSGQGRSAADAADYGVISATPWFKKAAAQKGYEGFAGRNVITGNREQFSCIKLLKNLDTQDVIGMMILNFDKAALKEVFPSYRPEQGAYAVVEQQEEGGYDVVLSSGAAMEEQEIARILVKGDPDYHLSRYGSSEMDWELVHMVQNRNLLSEAGKIQGIIMNGLAITIVLLLVLTVLLCNRITKPLYQLRDDIVRVGEGERCLETDFPDDEIGAIGQEFSRMVNEKLTLADQVTRVELKNKEAELELLQSNINPHFLYNTLDSLYWMAILHEAEDVAELTKALSDVFKIALSKGEKFIPIQKELDFVRSYLYIQNIRFEGKIHVDIQADESLMGYKVIKLLLQPFVENAVYHGLEPKLGSGTVVIKVYREQDFLCFEVADDGYGMDVDASLSKGYALRNSLERIRLVYGDDAKVEFKSSPGQGVQVKISLRAGVKE